MEIEILGTESLGVRGLSCFVRTKNKKVLIDPGIALGFLRYRLPPHPIQIATGERIRRKIVKAWSEATDIVFSHFHGDHVPLKDANPYQLDIKKVKGLNQRAKIWAKMSPLSPIERSRAEDTSVILKDTLIAAEESKGGELTFSKPVPHGEENTSDKVMLTRVEEDFVFIHASDIQLINKEAISLIVSWKPDIVLASGPPLYLSRLSNDLIEIVWRNAEMLSKNVETLILDHHLMRSLVGVRWLERLSSRSANKVMCGADFMKKPRLLLEAQRRNLYNRMPVPKGWHEAYVKGEVEAGKYWNMAKRIFGDDLAS